jgi:ureidoglycolate lyase
MPSADVRNGGSSGPALPDAPAPTLRIHELKIEPLTAEAFAPFGTLLDVRERPAGRRLIEYDKAFHVAGSTKVGVIWEPYSDLTLTQLERHFSVTQSFIPLSGSVSVMAVARPTDPDDPKDVPGPDQVRAFLIDGTVGFRYDVGTWHSPNRSVLHPPGATFVIVSVEPSPTQVVDYGKAFGVAFRYAL